MSTRIPGQARNGVPPPAGCRWSEGLYPVPVCLRCEAAGRKPAWVVTCHPAPCDECRLDLVLLGWQAVNDLAKLLALAEPDPLEMMMAAESAYELAKEQAAREEDELARLLKFSEDE